jgi:predicted trehalose synthase
MSNWPDLPLSEKAALSLAVKNYTLSYTNEDFFDTPEKRLNAVDLIEDLYVRLDDYDSALNYITEIYRSGTKDRQGLYNKMNSKKADGTYPTQAEKDRMESQIARINSTLSKTSDKKKDLEEKRIAAALPKITAIIGQNPQITEAELIVRIGEIGVSESVYGDLKEKNLIPVLSGPDIDIKDNGAAEKEEHAIV